AKKLLLVTECGLTDRMKVEFPDRDFVGTCNLCPYMKKVSLHNVLSCLRSPKEENIVLVPEFIRIQAEKALIRMFKLTTTSSD
ncbi:MAG TPA: quinolinate synthase NadA, partial [Candidatus Hodarchaeales archaeon]|nr:quinolinate synthase NadA [Candidatus Hodarchaeales archaeon]